MERDQPRASNVLREKLVVVATNVLRVSSDRVKRHRKNVLNVPLVFTKVTQDKPRVCPLFQELLVLLKALCHASSVESILSLLK